MTQSSTSSVKKVVLLCDFFSSYGGTENYNASLARGLKDRGIEVRIYVGEKAKLDTWREKLVGEGFFFKEPSDFHEDLTSHQIEKEFVTSIVPEINAWKPDVIHAHPFRKMAIQWLKNDAADHTIPVVVTEWTVPGINASHWFEDNTKKYVNRVDAYIATCTAITKGVREYHGYIGTIASIPHVLNITPEKRLPHTTESLNSVGCISRLSTEKGLMFLIGAWKRVTEHLPHHTLHIYGHGPDLAPLTLLRDCLGLQQNIIFEGTFEPGKAKEIAARHSVFAQPSLFESIPTSIIELMLYGRVVVASDVGGIPEIVKDQHNGAVVAAGSTDELAKSLVEILSSPARIETYSRAAYKDVGSTYNYEDTITKIIQLYESVAKNRRAIETV